MIQFNNTEIGYKESLFQIENLELSRGKFYTLIGKNGIGKTTLFNTLNKLIPLYSGEILMNNVRIQDIQHISKTSTFVPSKFDGVQHLSGRDFVALGRAPFTNFLGKLTSADHAVIDQTFSLLKIEYLTQKDTLMMSDGERQLLAIAKALVQETPVILLDEPCAFLDYKNKMKVLHVLKTLAEEKNLCIIQSSHDLDLSLEYCDQFLVINPREKKLSLYQQGEQTKQKLIEKAFG